MAIELDGTAAEVLNEEPLVIKNLKNWHHIHSYGGWGKFFHGLRKGKLLATRCTNSECQEQRLWLPPRCQCPDCWHDMEWVEAPTVATVYTHSTVLYPGAPFPRQHPLPAQQRGNRGRLHKADELLERGQTRNRHAGPGRL